MILVLSYKGFEGEVNCTGRGQSLYLGYVIHVPTRLSFCGQTVWELIDDFHRCIDDYLKAQAAT